MSKLHIITPWSQTRDFGKSINEAIEQLNPKSEDWILLRDGDSCFLTSDWGNLIHSAIEKHGHEYDLIGCLTNRLGGPHQCVDNFELMDLQKHYEIAVIRQKAMGHGVCEFGNDIAGFFMLFSVKIWRAVGGFKNTIVFDREFTKGVRMNGGKVGIMPGLYVLHCYRLWAPTREEARKSVEHLIK